MFARGAPSTGSSTGTLSRPVARDLVSVFQLFASILRGRASSANGGLLGPTWPGFLLSRLGAHHRGALGRTRWCSSPGCAYLARPLPNDRAWSAPRSETPATTRRTTTARLRGARVAHSRLSAPRQRFCARPQQSANRSPDPSHSPRRTKIHTWHRGHCLRHRSTSKQTVRALCAGTPCVSPPNQSHSQFQTCFCTGRLPPTCPLRRSEPGPALPLISRQERLSLLPPTGGSLSLRVPTFPILAFVVPFPSCLTGPSKNVCKSQKGPVPARSAHVLDRRE